MIARRTMAMIAVPDHARRSLGAGQVWVEAFLDDCLAALGCGFHPDTPGIEYQDEAGRATFTRAEARGFDRNMERAFAICEQLGLGIYALGVAAMRRHGCLG